MSTAAAMNTAINPTNANKPMLMSMTPPRVTTRYYPMEKPLETLLHPPLYGLERFRQALRIGATGLRHVRAPPALASHLRGDEIHQLSRLHSRDEVLCDAGDEAHLVAFRARQHDRARLEPVLQLVHRIAQRLGVRAFELRREHLHALHVDGVA